jgi:hypothetical protein
VKEQGNTVPDDHPLYIAAKARIMSDANLSQYVDVLMGNEESWLREIIEWPDDELDLLEDIATTAIAFRDYVLGVPHEDKEKGEE